MYTSPTSPNLLNRAQGRNNSKVSGHLNVRMSNSTSAHRTRYVCALEDLASETQVEKSSNISNFCIQLSRVRKLSTQDQVGAQRQYLGAAAASGDNLFHLSNSSLTSSTVILKGTLSTLRVISPVISGGTERNGVFKVNLRRSNGRAKPGSRCNFPDFDMHMYLDALRGLLRAVRGDKLATFAVKPHSANFQSMQNQQSMKSACSFSAHTQQMQPMNAATSPAAHAETVPA
eukprot:1283-Heterococcus_DN1.PRE.1